MPITNKRVWREWSAANQDPYGKACVDVARKVMSLLDEDPAPLVQGYNPKPHTAHTLICQADDAVKTGGITGFMAGFVAKMVVHCHSRGEEFRKSWNRTHDVDDKEKGTVNPAILTLRAK